jgi:hypothetical protein
VRRSASTSAAARPGPRTPSPTDPVRAAGGAVPPFYALTREQAAHLYAELAHAHVHDQVVVELVRNIGRLLDGNP